MRRAASFAFVGAVCAASIYTICQAQAIATPPPPAAIVLPAPAPSLPNPSFVQNPVIKAITDLTSPDALENLRASNFRHYLRAREILAAASELCQPGPPEVLRARFEDDNVKCSGMWLASLPPKRWLSFDLDDSSYVALVTVQLSGLATRTAFLKAK
jgi:hypothetical protein